MSTTTTTTTTTTVTTRRNEPSGEIDCDNVRRQQQPLGDVDQLYYNELFPLIAALALELRTHYIVPYVLLKWKRQRMKHHQHGDGTVS